MAKCLHNKQACFDYTYFDGCTLLPVCLLHLHPDAVYLFGRGCQQACRHGCWAPGEALFLHYRPMTVATFRSDT